jgi:hypothetical protein
MPKIHVLGGGTFSRVAPHLCLAARGNGQTARALAEEFRIVAEHGILHERVLDGYTVDLHLTSQGDPESKMVFNEDVSAVLDRLLDDPETKIIVMNCSMVDFEGVPGVLGGSGEQAWTRLEGRLSTRDTRPKFLSLLRAEKIIERIRKQRKDVFLVGFKQTANATADEQYVAGLRLLKMASCNLVLANDSVSRLNMVITPEQARYYETVDRGIALTGLVRMASTRHANGTFTRSEVVPGQTVPWNSPMIPATLRSVVDYCIANNAYKPFLGSTVGHFAYKVSNTSFLTSKRKSNYNDLLMKPDTEGLVFVESRNDHEVIAHGFKPSVGGQSQRILFREHPDLDCIVHAHIPLKPHSVIRRATQAPYECGSHECGQNTSRNLVEYAPGIWAVMLDQHGPNIVFNQRVEARKVIDFINEHFDLGGRTDGLPSGRGVMASAYA